MDPATAFSLGNAVALAAWLLLAVSLFLPRLRGWAWPATALVVPALLGGAYALLLAGALVGSGGDGAGGDGARPGFDTIEGVRAISATDTGVAAGWLHYLAFDLFVGSWIVRSGARLGLHPLLLLPCLALAFVAGPVGLLLFLGLRAALRRRAALAVD